MWFMNGVKPHKHVSPLALSGRVGQPNMGKPIWGNPTLLLPQCDDSDKNIKY